jgi:hypothetical protein
MRLFLLVALITTCGCAAMEHNTLISPSESLYYKANESYEQKAFSEAIELYSKFLEESPRSNLAVPAKLNLGMSYYYTKDYKQAYLTLKETEVKDANIKEYVDGILKICQAEAGDAIEAEKKTELSETTGTTIDGQIQILVSNAYIDDFGTLVLEGMTNKAATVTIDGEQAPLDGRNIFKASVSWRKGRSITIIAKDASGGSNELDYFPDGESPEEPEGLSVISASSNSIEIEWEESNEDDIKGYRLFYRLKGGSTKEVPNLIEDTEYEVVGLEGYVDGSNRTFQFYLRAVDQMNNESDDSDILEADLP